MSRKVKCDFDGLGNFFMHICPIDGKFSDLNSHARLIKTEIFRNCAKQQGGARLIMAPRLK